MSDDLANPLIQSRISGCEDFGLVLARNVDRSLLPGKRKV